MEAPAKTNPAGKTIILFFGEGAERILCMQKDIKLNNNMWD